VRLLAAILLAAWPADALAHDIHIPLSELRYGVERIQDTLFLYQTQPPIPPLPETPADQRRILGAAEIELALGNTRGALQLLMGRLADAKFQALPEYVATLLMTSQVLEDTDDHAGAMHYAELALKQGGTPDQMAEAGARWFRIARRSQRLDRRLEIYELWKSRGGEEAAGTEIASSVRYEAAFALRADNRLAEARLLLSRVPSESGFGSRAAYLAGVIFVEEGDLENADRWFSAVMDWALPAFPPEHPQIAIEREVRDLAALSAGRLRYERGALEEAAMAYQLIGDGSRHQEEACWERAYLDLERRKRRGALKNVQCVIDLGARGARFVDVKLFRASLLAHLSRYAASIESYQLLHREMELQRDLFTQAVKTIEHPSELLFSAMERNAVDDGRSAAPGPATLFADAWNTDDDHAYRVDRGIDHAEADLGLILAEIQTLTTALSQDTAFVGLDLRRQQLRRLLQEIHHLQGHAEDLQLNTARRHASTRVVSETHDHTKDAEELDKLVKELSVQAKAVEADLVKLDQLEASRRSLALRLLSEMEGELQGIARDAKVLQSEVGGTADLVSIDAIQDVQKALVDAAMRAEVGVLDTYWLKKQHRTEAIQNLIQLQKETEEQVVDALDELQREEEEAVAPAGE
jgi:hypothetical protein